MVACLHLRRYYVAWGLAEMGGTACGFGLLDGTTVPPRFGRSNNGDMLAVELAPSSQQAIGAWNVHTAHWLKHYIYLRCERPAFVPMSQRTFATMTTRMVSAFWHGFYPGYFLTFGFSMLGGAAEETCRKRIGPWFLSDGAPLAHLRALYTGSGVACAPPASSLFLIDRARAPPLAPPPPSPGAGLDAEPQEGHQGWQVFAVRLQHARHEAA